jgi:Raf kinase inhibitor-like YbhB/YbcL family protein
MLRRKSKMVQKICCVVAVCVLLCSFQSNSLAETQTKGEETMTINITSTAFKEGGMIPQQYTCDGKDMSPPLAWTSIHEGTKSLALICDDPDAPVGTWAHWVLFNLPADVNELPEHVPSKKTLENGAKQGMNDFRKIGYGGPCPPGGTHRYYFELYALNTTLDHRFSL